MGIETMAVTTMKNREVFANDPLTTTIPNLGVAKVVEPQNEQEWEVLRYELSSFVSQGEYGQGLDRILSTYLANLSRPEQPAVWVSGFYGSGKSHLVRVLEYLWTDVEFPDTAAARSITPLPEEIHQHLVELSTAGKREGGLWSAAGTLGAGAGNSVRLALLGILFRSARLPTQYAPARLVIYLKKAGSYAALVQRIEAEGRDLGFELSNMYVSPFLARALAEVVPDLPNEVKEVRQLLREQYPPKEDISDDELLETVHQVLALQSATPGRLPCTLLIFDELQQFIGEDPNRTLQVQNVVEACSGRFGSRLLFVATGQSALQATPQLQKLQGRFVVRVQLSDADVQTVVREVVLRKLPDKVPVLRTTLERASGEIDRQLAGTKIGPSQSDLPDLVPDYPLLPARRRFWEGVLRVVDSAGGAAQLRTQLRIVHDTTRDVADRPLGTVIPADAIYDQLEAQMQQSGILLGEVQQRIRTQDNNTPDGKLRSRLCATVFLLSKLASSGPAATGVEPTAETLADLLVEDLTDGGADLRQRVPSLLSELVGENVLIQVDNQYRLQTKESAEWQGEWQVRYTRIRGDESRVAGDRTDRLRAAVTSALRGITLTQGESKTPREFDLDFGSELPSVKGGHVPVWVRDEWSVAEGTVRGEAQHAGEVSPIVFVFLPRHESDALRDALAAAAAARETLDARPQPKTPEGIEAQTAMRSRFDVETSKVNALVLAVINRARVYGGGGNQLFEGSLAANVRTGIENALVRLFPRFGVADNSAWGRVVARAGTGAPDALQAVGWNADPEQHPVCKEVLQLAGGSGKRGAAIRNHFTGEGYGWPQDAVDGALLVLLGGGQLRATRNGQPVDARGLPQSQIGVSDFYAEDVSLTAKQRIELRGFLTELGIQAKPNEEAAGVQRALQELHELANRAGGDAPLPPCPSTTELMGLQAQAGNRQLVAVHEGRAQLIADWREWTSCAREIEKRLPRWTMLQRLLRYAGDLKEAEEIRAQVEAIEAERALLTDPDPVPPLATELTDALRAALQRKRAELLGAREEALRTLDATDAWQGLSGEQRDELLRASSLDGVPDLQLGSDTAVLSALESTSLSDWEAQIQAIPARATTVRDAAVRLVTPSAVTVRPKGATLHTADDVAEYLAELRAEIMEQIEAGHPVVI